MMDRVVMHIVERGPEVPVGTHRAFRSAKENFATAGVFLAVPRVRGPAVQTAEFAQEEENVGRFNKGVVVIRQHAPRENLTAVRSQDRDQRRAKPIEAGRAAPDVELVFVARGRKVIPQTSVVRAVGRRVPRMILAQARGEQLGALFRCEVAPDVAGVGHERNVSGAATESEAKFRQSRFRLKAALRTSELPPDRAPPRPDTYSAQLRSPFFNGTEPTNAPGIAT